MLNQQSHPGTPLCFSAIGRNWKQPECPTGGKINRPWCIHTGDCYAAVRRNELLVHSTTRLNLRITMLSRGSQTPPLKKKSVCLMIHSLYRKSKLIYSHRKQMKGCLGMSGRTGKDQKEGLQEDSIVISFGKGKSLGDSYVN